MKTTMTFDELDTLYNRLGSNNFKCGDWWPTIEEIQKHIEPQLNKNIEFTELDESTSFAIYSDEDVSKINHFGLKYLGSYDKVERDYLKKITISKLSWVILVLILILSLLSILLQ